MMKQQNKFHFTQGSLFANIIIEILKQSKQKMRILTNTQSQQKDIYTFVIASQIVQQEVQKVKIHEIKIVQIHRYITFYVTELVDPDGELIQNMFEVKPINLLQKKHMKIIIDQFWLNSIKYLPKKMNNTFLVSDIPTKSYDQIASIIQNRIICNIFVSSNQNKAGSQLLLRALKHNFINFNCLLKPAQYLNLQRTTTLIYKTLHSQQQYKALYEQRWGRTGFELQQRNWIKAYQNKIKNLKKMNKI